MKKNIQPYIVYDIDETGKKNDKFLLDNIPKASSEIKKVAREYFKSRGVSDEDIETFIKYMR